ncbi:hypothetical protein [Mucilaginibacter gotjawali]|uniref:Uncharacterized protein n=2 Tax=Mucilaginibacter gotjawali TaxID=1550579 RepID=A0A0X8X2P8_9SPHI|nr:hypothetical protein [Mucilaginibacter gotjawali]MBB3055831.1 hypothetical protein [Mucilaginibacter gotjawali]BAU54652.1 hypothetical protein MgSA37_02830 [Mucilaginibacter gotjawali]
MKVVYKKGDIIQPEPIKKETFKDRVKRRADLLNYNFDKNAIRHFKPKIN